MLNSDLMESIGELICLTEKLNRKAERITDPNRRSEVARVAQAIFTIAGMLDRIRLGWNAEDARAK